MLSKTQSIDLAQTHFTLKLTALVGGRNISDRKAPAAGTPTRNPDFFETKRPLWARPTEILACIFNKGNR